jgi:hypothetical protein
LRFVKSSPRHKRCGVSVLGVVSMALSMGVVGPEAEESEGEGVGVNMMSKGSCLEGRNVMGCDAMLQST